MLNLAVIGDPIDHTLSPKVHLAIANICKLEMKYEKYRVSKGELKEWFDFIIKNDICGFSVTMPHKTDIIQFLDFVDEEASMYNAVNTVKNDNGVFKGYNTDATGFCLSLQQVGCDFKDKYVTFFGAGGAARTLAVKAELSGARQIELLRRNFDVPSDTDILINATPLGMHGFKDDFNDFSFLSKLSEAAMVCDLVYNPSETLLLKEAKRRNLKTINGFGMLIYQAIAADEIFLGQSLKKQWIFEQLSF